ncbi:hypothetical protein HFZ78_13445 [Priestia megaterium]|uniref:Uncharacterized protein n=1 Tax=Priestia megaterium TaxID=1404 RepID=A0A6H1P2D7_PRIMG|nr:hypothetical protein HFZ78_13445 [Priestia megaterium]
MAATIKCSCPFFEKTVQDRGIRCRIFYGN